MARTYIFVFDSAAEAKVFVERLLYYGRDLATYRDESTVTVIDGCADDQRELIFRLGRSTGARRAVWRP